MVKRNNRLSQFPAIILAVILFRLSLEISYPTAQSYIGWNLFISLPFILFYGVEVHDYLKETDLSKRVSIKTLLGSIGLVCIVVLVQILNYFNKFPI